MDLIAVIPPSDGEDSDNENFNTHFTIVSSNNVNNIRQNLVENNNIVDENETCIESSSFDQVSVPANDVNLSENVDNSHITEYLQNNTVEVQQAERSNQSDDHDHELADAAIESNSESENAEASDHDHDDQLADQPANAASESNPESGSDDNLSETLNSTQNTSIDNSNHDDGDNDSNDSNESSDSDTIVYENNGNSDDDEAHLSPIVNYERDTEIETDYEQGWDWILGDDNGAQCSPFLGRRMYMGDIRKTKPEDFFNQLFEPAMWDVLTVETNRYANNRKTRNPGNFHFITLYYKQTCKHAFFNEHFLSR